MEVDKLKQYSQSSCLVISGVELPPKKATENAEETEEKARWIIETNLDISRENFDNELDSRLIKSHQTKKSSTQASEYHM